MDYWDSCGATVVIIGSRLSYKSRTELLAFPIVLIPLGKVCIYQPLHMRRMPHKVKFYTEFNWLIQSFPFPRLVAIPRLKSPVCPSILPIARERIVWFIPFPRVFAQCDMQTDSSRIWIWVIVSVFFDTTSAFMGKIWIEQHSVHSLVWQPVEAKKFWFETRPGKKWPPPGYSCSKQSTCVTLPRWNQVTGLNLYWMRNCLDALELKSSKMLMLVRW